MRPRSFFAAALALALNCAIFQSFGQNFRLGAIVARQDIDWNGYNVIADSFDSANTNWSTSGLYDPLKAKDNGDIFSGGSIVDPIGVSTAHLYGHVQIGPTGSIAIGSSGGIGQHSWQTLNPGEIEPGWLLQTSSITPPDIIVPDYRSYMPVPACNSSCAVVFTNNGTGYYTNYYDHILDEGYYYSTDLSGATLVRGNCVLVLPGGFNLSGPDNITIDYSSSLTIYSATNSFFNGDEIMNQTGLARNFQLLCAPGVTNLVLAMNRTFRGVINAPEADLKINGAGTNFADISGSIVCKTLQLNGNFNFHFDESLITAPAQLESPRLNGSHLSFDVEGAQGFSYIVQASTDLNDWISLTTNTAPFNFQDAFTNFTQRYYRAVRVP
jgi:hypothetical protein